MYTSEIISAIKNQGKATVWYVQQSNYNEASRDKPSFPNWEEIISEFFLDREEAYKKMEEECQSCKSEFGEYNKFTLWFCELTQEDLEKHLEGWEDPENEDLCDNDILLIIEAVGRDLWDCCLESSYEYEDV